MKEENKTPKKKKKRTKQNENKQSTRFRVQNTGHKDGCSVNLELQEHQKQKKHQKCMIQ